MLDANLTALKPRRRDRCDNAPNRQSYEEPYGYAWSEALIVEGSLAYDAGDPRRVDRRPRRRRPSHVATGDYRAEHRLASFAVYLLGTASA